MIFSEPILITRFAPGAQADSGTFEGLASSWAKDRHGDVIARGAFQSSIAALAAGKQRIPFLLNHDSSRQLGGLRSATETADGLLVSGQIVLGSRDADRVHALSKADQMSLSVGFMPVDAASEPMEGGGTLYRSVDLAEVSAVPVPSNRESRVLRVKALADHSPAELERLLREGELPPMARRMAAKLTRAWIAALNDIDSDEPIHDPAKLEALSAAAMATLKILKPRSK